MKHLDEGALQALFDGELPPEERRAAEAHLTACAECAAAAAALRADLHTLASALARADVAPPSAAARMSFRARRAGAGSRWTGEARRALLRAATLLLALGGVAAAATPPVRRWVVAAVAPRPEPRRAEAPEPRRAPAPPAEAPAEAGVSILPDAGSVRVVVNRSARGLRVRTRLSDSEYVGVSVIGEAASGRFRTAPGRIEVVGAGPGEIHIALPRGARAATVEVDGRVFVAKEDGRLRVMAPAASSADVETVFRVDE